MAGAWIDEVSPRRGGNAALAERCIMIIDCVFSPWGRRATRARGTERGTGRGRRDVGGGRREGEEGTKGAGRSIETPRTPGGKVLHFRVFPLLVLFLLLPIVLVPVPLPRKARTVNLDTHSMGGQIQVATKANNLQRNQLETPSFPFHPSPTLTASIPSSPPTSPPLHPLLPPPSFLGGGANHGSTRPRTNMRPEARELSIDEVS